VARAEDFIAELSAVDPAKVEQALRGLAGLGEEVLGKLMTRLEREGDGTTRVNLLRAVGRVALENEYFDPSVVKRLRALRTEQGFGDTADQQGRFARATYVKILGMVGEPGCFDEILGDVKSFDPRIRANALEGLAFIIKRWTVTGGRKVQQAVEEAVKDDIIRVSVTATAVLYLIHAVAADNLRSRIRDMAHSTDDQIRSAARTAAASFDIKTENFFDLFARDSVFALLRRYDDQG